MAKQLLDLKNGIDEKVNKFSKLWKINKTDTILRMIKEFPEIRDDGFDIGNETNLGDEFKW